MKKMAYIYNTKRIFLFSLIFACINVFAKENIPNPISNSVVYTKVASGCAPSTSQTDLDVNNVRTTILAAGDMWWNLDDARYEIPKNGNKHSMFAGALWIGGYDDNGQLKVAGQTYRQSGSDYWPGPLDNVRLTSEGINNSKYGSTEASICAQYNEHFVILRTDVEAFVAWSNSENPSVEYPDYVIPESILNYPGNRTTDDLSNAFLGYDDQVGSSPYYALETLAPYEDVNGDGYYDALAGDYPQYNLNGALNCKEGDMLFIPKFYAHGYECLTKKCIVLYHLEKYRDPKNESGVPFDDKKLKIKWKTKNPIISKRDMSHNSFEMFKKTIKGL